MQYTKSRKKGRSLISFPESYCVVDIETTGLSPELDSIIEVSGVKYSNGEEIDRYVSLLKPDSKYDDGTYIDEFIEELTGITNDMLETAPDTLSVLKEFNLFLSDSIIVGHNVNFDINFLYDFFEKYLNVTFSNDFIDTMRISRRLHPEEKHHRLKDLVKRYEIDYSGAHRAHADCVFTQQCYICLQKDAISKYGSLDAFVSYINKSLQYNYNVKSIVTTNTSFDITHPLYGKVCVFTGTLEKASRKEAMQIVADLGGINGNSVTKKTNFLILGNNDYCTTIKEGKSIKQKKAEKLKLDGYDIEIIPENVFYDMVFVN